MNITRDEAVDHLTRGYPVLINGVYTEPTRGRGQMIVAPKNVPAADTGTKFAATRHDDGTFTRAGMAAVIQAGGSIMFPGSNEPVTDVADLPAEEAIAAGSVKRLEKIREQQLETLRALQADHQRTADELDKARAAADKVKRGESPAPTDDQATHDTTLGVPGVGTPLGAPKIGSVTPPAKPATTTTAGKPGK
jgi:hypothetical protein